MDFLDDLVDHGDAETIARTLAVGRIVVGVLMLLAPRTALGALTRGGRGEVTGTAATATRMTGVRDLSLGLGVILASRHRSPALRGWVEAAALADAADAATFLTGRGVARRARLFGPVVAGCAAVLGMSAARALER